MSESAVLGSVVIPAHNEAAVIARCLDALLADFQTGELDVVVSCNGCTDGTAEVVRSSGHAVRVVEIARSSKTAALRAADQAITVFPRIYLDADVVLPSVAARRVLDYLHSDGALAARPPIRYNTRDSTLIVRSYYRTRSGVPALMGSLWGAGVYGLSAEGRARFVDFPDLIGDDLYIDQHFRRDEIAVINAPPVVVNVPHGAADLLRILRRIYKGNSENRALPVRRPHNTATTKSTIRDLVDLAFSQPLKVLDVSIYVLLAVVARCTLAVAPSASWERDHSSRAGLVAHQASGAQRGGPDE